MKKCIGVAGLGGAYIVSSGCELPYNATIEKVQFFIEAGREYGKTERILPLGT